MVKIAVNDLKMCPNDVSRSQNTSGTCLLKYIQFLDNFKEIIFWLYFLRKYAYNDFVKDLLILTSNNDFLVF